VIVSTDTIDKCVWFLEIVAKSLGNFMPIIMSDKNPTIITSVAQEFGKEHHSYRVRYLMENFLKEVAKHGIRKEATKQIVKAASWTNTNSYANSAKLIVICQTLFP